MDILSALKDGYSKSEVMEELGRRTGMNYKQALSDGYSEDDVLGELNRRDLEKKDRQAKQPAGFPASGVTRSFAQDAPSPDILEKPASLDFIKEERPKDTATIGGEAWKGAKSGMRSFFESDAALGEYSSKLTGPDYATEGYKKIRKDFGKAQEKDAPAVGDIRDIESTGDFGKWASWNMGQMGGQMLGMLPFMFTGGPEAEGAVTGFQALKGLVTSAPGAAGQFTKFLAQWAKPKAVDIPIGVLEGGSIAGGQLDEVEQGKDTELHPFRGLAAAFVATKLEELGAENAVNNLIKGIGGKKGNLIKRIAQSTVGTGVGEGTEEFFQTYAEQFGINPKDIASKETFMQAVNGAAAGFVGGFGIGGVTGSLSRNKDVEPGSGAPDQQLTDTSLADAINQGGHKDLDDASLEAAIQTASELVNQNPNDAETFNILNSLQAEAEARKQASLETETIMPQVETKAEQAAPDYSALITTHAEQNGIEPSLLSAVAQADGGLIAISPQVAQYMGMQDAQDPDQNLEGGARYLSALLQHYQGDEVKALAAYKMGVAAVNDQFRIESAPKEVQDYIASVQNLNPTGLIDSGLRTGQVNGQPFGPNEAVSLIQQKMVDGTFTKDHLNALKDKHPVLSEPLNDLIAASLAAEINQAAAPITQGGLGNEESQTSETLLNVSGQSTTVPYQHTMGQPVSIPFGQQQTPTYMLGKEVSGAKFAERPQVKTAPPAPLSKTNAATVGTQDEKTGGATPLIGSTASWSRGKETFSGTVKAIDKNGTLKIAGTNGKIYSIRPDKVQNFKIETGKVSPPDEIVDSGANNEAGIASPDEQRAKEPWEMTLEGWRDQMKSEGWRPRDIKDLESTSRLHKNEVERALSEGKPVPQEVLEQYPDLAAKKEEGIVSRIDNAVNTRERSNRLVEEGQKAVPGIRLQDAEEAGRWAYVVAKGDATQGQFDAWIAQAKKENRISDARGSDYFDHTDTSAVVPVKEIIPRQEPRQASVETAKTRMAAAKAGKGNKRKPLTVVKRHDGKYKIVDGNATLHALQELGEEHAVVHVKKNPRHHKVSSIEDLKEKGLTALPELEKLTEDIAKEHDGKVKLRPGGGLKSDTSIEKKVAVETKGRYDKVIDAAATSVIFRNIADLQRAKEKLMDDPRVYEVRDRFGNPLVGGYEDVNIKIGLSNGYVGELQLQLEWLYEAKEAICHQIYDLIKGLHEIGSDEATELENEAIKISEAIYSSTSAAKSFALSSVHLSALRKMWDALSRSSTSSVLDPLILNNLRDALLKTKGMPSLSKYSRSDDFPAINNAPPSDQNIPTREKNVKGLPDGWEKVPGGAIVSTFADSNYLISGEPGKYRLTDESSGRVIGGTYTDIETAAKKANQDWIERSRKSGQESTATTGNVEKKSPYGPAGRAAFRKIADAAGLKDDFTNPDYSDFVSFFEEYYNAGLNGRRMPAITMHPQDAHAAYQAGRKDAETDIRKVEKKNKPSSKLAGIYRGNPNEARENPVAAENAFKKDLNRFAGELQDALGYEPDVTTKGAKHRNTTVSINIAPIGGDGTIILWKPNSEYGIYIDVSVQREYNDDSLKIGGIAGPIMYRATEKKKKYTGFVNRWENNAAITPQEFAEKIKAEVDFYDRVPEATTIIKEAQDAGFTKKEISTAFAEGEKVGQAESTTGTPEEIQEKIDEIVDDLGVEVKKEPTEDLTKKSTADLISDIFAIINDHIGQRGSLSFAEKENALDESLYQKIKPYLAVVADRAKARAFDVKAYLFGAVDAMPSGPAKDIYEAAADQYVTEALDNTNKKDKLKVQEGNKNEPKSDGDAGARTLEGNKPESLPGDGEGRGTDQRERSGSETDDEGDGSADDDRGPGSVGMGGEQGIVHLQELGSDEEELSSQSGEITDAPEGQPRPLKRSGVNPGNYRITEEDDIGSGTRGVKIERNLAAIRLVKKLDQENRYPTKEEQAVLAKYVGWGGLKSVFDKTSSKPQDVKAREELKSLLTKDEYLEAFLSITNAHYTSPKVIESIYKVLRHFGFTGGNVLEPTYGSGNFIGLMPEDMAAGSSWYGSELDKITAKIGQYLYPDSQLVESGFQDAEFPFGKYDLAIGNPPFGDERITDTNKGRAEINRFMIHNYVIAKSGMHLKPGGVMAMVVTSRFLDTANPEARNFLAKQFRFLGAIRLPNDAFAKNAGTEVTTDIVFLQRLMPDETPEIFSADWLTTGGTMKNADGETITLNKYFAERPQLMLGEPSMKGTMYGGAWKEGGKGEFTLDKRPGQADTDILIDEVIEKHFGELKNIVKGRAVDQADAEALSWQPNQEDVGIGGFYENDGKIYLRGDNDEYNNPTFEMLTPKTQWTEKTVLGQKRYDRIKGMLKLRKLAYNLIKAERFDLDNIEDLRAELNKQYDAFVKEHGLLSESANFSLMADDVRIEFGLETGYKKEITKARAKALGLTPAPATANKASILKERVFYPEKEILFAKTAADGYSISLSQKGRLDIEYIAKLTNKTQSEVIDDLTAADLIYQDPETQKWIQEDEYLSGNVKEKYKKVEGRSGFERNAEALKKVFPADLQKENIKALPGAPWIPEAVYQQFGQFLGLQDVEAHYYPQTGAFRMEAGTLVQNEISVSMVNQDYNLDDVFNAAANNRTLIAYDGSGDNRTTNKDRTAALATIVKTMRQVFDDWIFADAERAADLCRIYNETQNTNAERKFEGTHLQPVGINPAIQLLDTQRNAAWRIVQSPVVLLDHCVGSGKTFTIITGCMERVRMGLSKKVMIAVPNHLVGQWAAEYMRLYPGANILAATKKDFQKANRHRLFARIATGNFDAVIVGHSSFGFIPVENETVLNLVQEELEQLEAAEAAANAAGDKRTARALAKRIQKKRERIKELLNKPRDNVTTFEAMGIDHLVVDESHEFKNLEYSSGMTNIAGMGTPMGSKRAFDLYTKIRWLSRQPNHAINFATGTPISNSLVEMYAILRYLNRAGLVSRGMEAFDAWANSYASVEPRVEYTASQRLKTRIIMASFGNLPELLQLYNEFADTVTQEDLKRIYADQIRERNARLGTNESEEFPIPKMESGGRQLDAADASPAQREYVDYLVARSIRLESLGRSNDPKVDNALWIMSDARKMALDIRLVDPSAPADLNNKTSRACKRIKEYYDRSTPVKGAQLVFCDLSTPSKTASKNAGAFIKEALKKAGLEKDPATLGILQSLGTFQEKWGYIRNRIEAEIEFLVESDLAETEQYMDRCEKLTAYLDSVTDDVTADLTTADTGFSVYDDMKATLINMGVPEGEIKFIHDANTEAQKQELFDLVNTGQIRVLIGSSMKMGAGMNVQERLVALHHMDAPWRPSDVEQREGRIVRQGNHLYLADPSGFNVGVWAYSTKNTFDAVSWQILARKGSMLDDFRSGAREVEDKSSDASSYSDFMAETTGNPAFREKYQLEAAIKELESVARRIATQRQSASVAADSYKINIPLIEETNKQREAQLAAVAEVDHVTYRGTNYPANAKDIVSKEEDRLRAINRAIDDEFHTALMAEINAELNKPGNEKLTEEEKEKIAFTIARDTKIKKPKHTLYHAEKLAKTDKTGIVALGLQIIDTLNAAPVDTAVEFKFGDVTVEIKKNESRRWYNDNDVHYQFDVSVDGLPIRTYGEGRTEFPEFAMWDLLSDYELRFQMKAKLHENKASLAEMKKYQAQAEMTLEKLKFKDQDKLDKMLSRYQQVLREVRDAELDMARRRVGTSNRHIEADVRRFSDFDPWATLRHELEAAEAGLPASLKEISDDLFEDYRGWAETAFVIYERNVVDDPGLGVKEYEGDPEAVVEALIKGARAEAILANHGRGDMWRAARMLGNAAKIWNYYNDIEEPLDADLHKTIKDVGRIIGGILKQQGNLFEDALYSTTPTSGAGVTESDLQELFPGQRIKKIGDRFIVITKNGGFFTIDNVETIDPNNGKIMLGYGRRLKQNEVIAGSYLKGEIKISKAGDKWTLAHESIHYLEDAGLLDDMDIKVLRNHIRKLSADGKFKPTNKADIGGAEDRADFLAMAMRERPKYTGLAGRVMNKIYKIIDAMGAMFGKRTAGAIAREVKSGDIYNKEAKRTLGASSQSAVTQSLEFKKWFGNSKVVDENGTPLRAYHGTAKYFEAFDTTISKENRNSPSWSGDVGTWFAAPSKYQGNYDEGNAEAVAETFTEKPGGGWNEYKDGARIVPVYLSIKNPMEFEEWEHFDDVRRDEYRGLSGRQFRDKLIEQGYDGMVIRNSMTDGDVDRDDWVAFSPTQIKSATANVGTYDANNPDIRYKTVEGTTSSGPEKPRKLKTVEELVAWLNQQSKAASNPLEDAPERKQSSLSKKAYRQALKSTLIAEDRAPDVLEYDVMPMQEQADLAADLINRDIEKAKRIALGQEEPEGKLRKGTVYRAIELWAHDQGDTELIAKLIRSPISLEMTKQGQEIAATRKKHLMETLGMKYYESPVNAVKDVEDTLAENVEKKTGKRASKEAVAEAEAWEKKLSDLEQTIADQAAEIKKYTSQEYIDELIKKHAPAKEGKTRTAKPKAEYGAKNKVFTQERHDKALNTLKGIFGRVSANPMLDPQAHAALVELGGYHFEAGARKFAEWAQRIVDDVGPGVKPHLRDTFEKVKDAFGIGLMSKIKKGIEKGRDLGELQRHVNDLAISFIEEGVTDGNELVEAVYNELQQIDPDITLEETRDAISGYGKWTPLTHDEVLDRYREIKQEQQLLAKIRDLEEQGAMRRTGKERQEMTQLARDLNKQVHALKIKYGMTTTEENQLPSALESYKKRLNQQIADLDEEIKSKQKIVKEKFNLELDAEAKELIQTRDSKKAEREAIFGKPEMTDEQRIKLAIQSAKKATNEYNRRIAEHDFSSLTKKGNLTSEELTKARKDRDDAKKAYQELREAENPGAAAMKALETRLNNELNRYKQMIANRDFVKQERKPRNLSPELKRLMEQRDTMRMGVRAAAEAAGRLTNEDIERIAKLASVVTELREAIDNGGDRLAYGAAVVAYHNYIEDLKGINDPIKTLLSNRIQQYKAEYKENPGKAIFNLASDSIKSVFDNSVAMVASFDDSFMGRQGLKVLFTHPSAWWPGAKNSVIDFIKTLGGQETIDAMKADIYSRPNFVNGSYGKAGIIAAYEEQYPANLAERAPVIGRVFKASEAAFVGSGMRMRADLYDLLADQAKSNGKDVLDQKEFIEPIGKLINNLTARGSWGKHRGESRVTRLILWAPKMLMANINTLVGVDYWTNLRNPTARREAGLNWLKVIGTTALIMAVASALGDDDDWVEWDPRSTDFGKIKIGDTRFDITGGMGSIVVLAARIITGKKKSATTGIVQGYTGDSFRQSRLDAFVQFLINKTTPPMGIVRDWLEGKTPTGERFTPEGAIYRAMTPIAVQNFIKLKDSASADRLAGAIVDVFGINTSSYSDSERQWNPNGSQREQKLYQRVGEKRFQELNKEYNTRVDSHIKELKRDPTWQRMSDEDKQAKLDKGRERIKAYYLGK